MEYINGKMNMIGLEVDHLTQDRYYYFIDDEQNKYHLKHVSDDLSVITNDWGVRVCDIYAEDSDELQQKVNNFFNKNDIVIIKYGLKFN